MKIFQISEFDLIKKIKDNSIFSPERIIQGIGDDAAVEKINPNKYLVSTCDMLVEESHFLRDKITPEQLGHKAVAVNLSDIAAMGAIPTGILISLGIPKDLSVSYVEKLYQGIKAICKKFAVNILGGDTIRTPKHIVINVTALGEISPKNLILRSGAKVGDAIFLTGTVGDSGAGLDVILKNCDKERYHNLVHCHLKPMPQVEEGAFLAATGLVNSMNDISDGLANEILEIAEESDVGANIFVDSIPISLETKLFSKENNKEPLYYALYGGEDFQLVFTCPDKEARKLQKLFLNKFKKNLYKIGIITEKEQGINLVGKDFKEKLIKKGYDHFKK